MNLAWHWGARRLVLLGFDCQGQPGKTHWFGDHPKPLNHRHNYGGWQASFKAMAEDLARDGVSVINCSPSSALTYWPKASVEEALARPVPAATAA